LEPPTNGAPWDSRFKIREDWTEVENEAFFQERNAPATEVSFKYEINGAKNRPALVVGVEPYPEEAPADARPPPSGAAAPHR